MTDYEGIKASKHPRLANPARHDHQKWVQARREEIRKKHERQNLLFTITLVAMLVALGVVVAFSEAIDAWCWL